MYVKMKKVNFMLLLHFIYFLLQHPSTSFSIIIIIIITSKYVWVCVCVCFTIYWNHLWYVYTFKLNWCQKVQYKFKTRIFKNQRLTVDWIQHFFMNKKIKKEQEDPTSYVYVVKKETIKKSFIFQEPRKYYKIFIFIQLFIYWSKKAPWVNWNFNWTGMVVILKDFHSSKIFMYVLL